MGEGKPRPVEVTHLGGGQFDMRENGSAKKVLDFDKKSEKLGKDDWHEVVFKLDDKSGTLRFHPDPRQAIWVARGNATTMPPCPTGPTQDPEGEFKGVDVSRDGSRLVVHNINETVCNLQFRLNFSDVNDQGSNPQIVAFHDPGVSNRNGSI